MKGATGNALLCLPFEAAYLFRPNLIEALPGVRSRTPQYNVARVVLEPLLGLACGGGRAWW